MKKLYLTLPALLLALALQAQEFWFEAALKGGGGLSFLLNKNVMDDSDYEYALTPMYGFGGKLSTNFGPNHGVAIEAMYNQIGQDWKYDLNNLTDLENETRLKSLDAYLLYRYTSYRTYVEVGPMYSFVQSAEQTDMGVKTDVTDFYEKNYLAGVFGFGGLIAGAETFSFGIGIRLHYGLTDIVNDRGQAAGQPNPLRNADYASAENTRPAFAQVLLEFNFGLGRFAKTACADRWKLSKRRR